MDYVNGSHNNLIILRQILPLQSNGEPAIVEGYHTSTVPITFDLCPLTFIIGTDLLRSDRRGSHNSQKPGLDWPGDEGNHRHNRFYRQN